MADRFDCYKYTNKMIEAPTRDESRIRKNSNYKDIESLKLENAELKKMTLELRRSLNELADSNKKTDKSEDIEKVKAENAELKK